MSLTLFRDEADFHKNYDFLEILNEVVFRQPATREKRKNEEYKQYITDSQILSSSELDKMELEHREIMQDIDFDPEIIEKINKTVTDDQEFLRNDKELKAFKK